MAPTPKRKFTPRVVPALSIALLVAFAVALGACGSSGSDDVDPGNAEDAPDYTKMVKGAPPEFASIYNADGAGLLDGGADAYNAKLDELKGYPVVVNKWASWCGPCRVEFPEFQAEAAERGDQVAFLGINANDSADAAATFLSTHPIPYGSYSDPDEDLSNDLGASPEFPTTIFYSPSGEKTFVHRGPYSSQADLAADIDKYAVNG